MYRPLRTRGKDGPWDAMCVADHDGADHWQCEFCVLFFKCNADPNGECKTCYSGLDNLCPVDKRIPFWWNRPHTLAFCSNCMTLPSVWRCMECKSDLYHRHRDVPVESFCRACYARGLGRADTDSDQFSRTLSGSALAQQVEPEPDQGILTCIENVHMPASAGSQQQMSATEVVRNKRA